MTAAASILISGSGPWQWGDFLREALTADFPDAATVIQVSASLDGWAVEVTLSPGADTDAFVARLELYLSSEPDPWDVNIVVDGGR